PISGVLLSFPTRRSSDLIEGFCDSLRTELLHDKSNVRVTMVQLSAFNTPQFGWVKSRLPRRAQPVPPIFQPVVAAEAIYFAACQDRKSTRLNSSHLGISY